VRCPACDAPHGAAARYCDQCGTRLPPLPVAPATSQDDGREAPQAGDRRVVTALFADLVDYVRMLAEHDAEEVKRRVDAALATLDASVGRFGGSREKFIGDAVFAVFGYPTAHDDDALRAGLCALEMRTALADMASHGEEPLNVRIGLATGEVVASPRAAGESRDGAVSGPAIAIAARIQGLAAPGEILADSATVQAARGRLAVEDRGTTRLRGHPTPVHLHALTGEQAARPAAAPATRLVGRIVERARLVALIDACRATGAGGVAVVIGDAGIGKSRLIADLETDAREAGLHWTWTDNVSYGAGEPYRFLRAFAQAIADEEGTDSGTLARRLMFSNDLDPGAARRIAGAIAAMAREASFSGWEAEAVHAPTDATDVAAAILEAALRYIARLGEVLGPRVIVVDDLHWADPSSQPALEQLARAASELPLVVIFGTRSGGLPPWLEAPGVERIELGGLSPEETRDLAREVAGSELARPDAHAVHERTRGNPLFVAETVRALLDDGSLAIRGGRLELVADPAAGGLPLTLRALLGARIDALSQAGREVLGVAAVIGMTFRTDVVAELVGRSPRRSVLDGLAGAALIVAQDGGTTWRFAHPLIRETAYAGLLTVRRRALHARLADRLEVEPRVAIGRVARHRAAAGDVARAVPLLDRAARDALALGATTEAAEFWRAAARLVGDGDSRAAEFRRAAVVAQHAGSTGQDGAAGQPTGAEKGSPPAIRGPILSAGGPTEPS
jgi:class 3 adenylate cyclase